MDKGNLLTTETPSSELFATVEMLGSAGVRREHFARMRSVNGLFAREVAEFIIRGGPVNPVFLPQGEQFRKFAGYNLWLQDKYPDHVIAGEEVATTWRKLANLPDDALIFYNHGDPVLNAQLAWEYTCFYRQKTWKWEQVKFEQGWMKPDDREPKRPTGFYWLRRPPEDADAIGKKFQNRKVADVRGELGNNWGMGAEGLQFVGITHTHYPELMDGDKFPFIDLPRLAVAPSGDGDFYSAPYLDFRGGVLRLCARHIVFANPGYGSGSLQQC